MAQNTDTTATPEVVTKNATTQTEANLGRLILLGTFGPSGDQTALLRLSNGTTAQVGKGDKIGRDTVIAVEDGRLALARNGDAHWLSMP